MLQQRDPTVEVESKILLPLFVLQILRAHLRTFLATESPESKQEEESAAIIKEKKARQVH